MQSILTVSTNAGMGAHNVMTTQGGELVSTVRAGQGETAGALFSSSLAAGPTTKKSTQQVIDYESMVDSLIQKLKTKTSKVSLYKQQVN